MSVRSEGEPGRHRLTVEEYYRMAEVGLLASGARMELIDGEIIDMPPIGSRHAAAVDFIAKQLIRAVGDDAIVRVQGPVRLSSDSELQPDLAVLRPHDDRYVRAHPTAADVLLLVEVSDTTLRFDRDVKASVYAREGVPAVWVVDLDGARIERLGEPRPEGYARRYSAAAGVVGVPGLAVDVDLTALFLREPGAKPGATPPRG